MRNLRGWVWHGLDDPEYQGLMQGLGGQWQRQTAEVEPLAVIHLPGGGRHEVEAPERDRIGFRR